MNNSTTKTRITGFNGVLGGSLVLGGLGFLGFLATGMPARAEFTLTYEQVGPDVVVTGSGSIDTSALTNGGSVTLPAFVNPNIERMGIGTTATVNGWKGYISGPISFGVGGAVLASSASGDAVGFVADTIIYLPLGYVSGAPLADTAIYNGKTIAGLGLTPGDYTWTWGSGATADAFNVAIGPVPEPATLALFGVGALALLARRQATPRQ